MRYISKFVLFALFAIGANAQDVKKISATARAVEGGLYDRVEMLRTTLYAGKAYAISFPCLIDGYYFGADAPRYVVKNTVLKNGNVCVNADDIELMVDEADFEPNVTYVVVPKVNTDFIVGLTAGLKTRVYSTELVRDVAYLLGDMDSDMYLTVADVARMINCLNGGSMSSVEKIVTDVDLNGLFTKEDVDKLAKQIVNLKK